MVRTLMGHVNRPINASTGLLASTALASGTLGYGSVTRSGTAGTYTDPYGTINSAPANTARVNNSQLVGTNLLHNPRFDGTVPGNPGTSPTAMSFTGVGSVVKTIVGTGYVNDMPYIDLRVEGITTAITMATLFISTATLMVPYVQGDTLTFSLYTQLRDVVALPSNITPTINERDVANTYLTETNKSVPLSGSLELTTLTRTATSPTCAKAYIYVAMNGVIGQYAAFTLRIAGIQVELGTTRTQLSLQAPGTINPSAKYVQPRLLVEESRTNYIRNPRAEGGTTGNPGNVPTNWSFNIPAGLARNIIGYGTEGGIPYMDVSYTGQNTSGSAYNINLTGDSSGNLAPGVALVGTTWTGSFYARLMSGTMPTGTFDIYVNEYDNTSTYIGGGNYLQTKPTAAPLITQRSVATRTFANATANQGGFYVRIAVPDTEVVNFTLRIGGWQWEQGTFPTSLIFPPVGSPAATTRSADDVYIPVTSFAKFAPSVTNLLQRSSDMTVAPWGAGGGGLAATTANAGVAPDGTSTATLVDDTSSGALLSVAQNVTIPTGVASYTASVYLKAGTSTVASLRFSTNLGTPSIGEVVVDLTNGVAQWRSANVGSAFTITSVGSGWYRVSSTVISVATNNFATIDIRPAFAGTYGPTADSSVLGNVLVWGAQVEATDTNSPNQYIPTVATAVTKTKLAPGTLVARVKTPPTLSTATPGIVCFGDAGMSARGGIRFTQTSTVATFAFYVFGAFNVQIASAQVFTPGAVQTFAYSWDGNNTYAVGPGVSLSLPNGPPLGMVQLKIGGSSGGIQYLNSEIESVTYYPYKMTTAQMQGVIA